MRSCRPGACCWRGVWRGAGARYHPVDPWGQRRVGRFDRRRVQRHRSGGMERECTVQMDARMPAERRIDCLHVTTGVVGQSRAELHSTNVFGSISNYSKRWCGTQPSSENKFNSFNYWAVSAADSAAQRSSRLRKKLNKMSCLLEMGWVYRTRGVYEGGINTRDRGIHLTNHQHTTQQNKRKKPRYPVFSPRPNPINISVTSAFGTPPRRIR